MEEQRLVVDNQVLVEAKPGRQGRIGATGVLMR